MKYSYYTINDLRLGCDPKGAAGWRLSQFPSLSDALEHYRSLPDHSKSLGLTDGFHVLELVRRFPPPRSGVEGVDVLVSDFRVFPFWREVREAAEAANACVSALNIGYVLVNDRPVPMAACQH